jgi:hypothetical protein
MRWLAVVSALVVVAATECRADTTDVVTGSDTTLFVPVPGDGDSALVIDTNNLERHLYQNPTAALFKSLLVPGLGQVGNHRYVKAVIYAGLEGWFIGAAIHYGKQADNFKRKYDATTDVANRNAYHSLYKDRADERSKYVWFAGIATFVSMFDAYVDAHLSGSPMAGRNRKFEVGVVNDNRGGPAVQLAYRF